MAGKSPSPAADQKPELEVDQVMLENLTRFGAAQAPPEEMARALGMPLGQLKKILKGKSEACVAYEKARALGLITLREAQFKLAATSVPMAMMLAKTYLGHDERRETDEDIPFDRVGAAERVRAKLAAIAAAGQTDRDPQGDGGGG